MTSYIVLDFEATCFEEPEKATEHEIIEWPMALLDFKEGRITREFRHFVRPKNQKLSEFCKNLTGIQQEQVDQAKQFPEILDLALDWLKEIPQPIVFLICGNWDLDVMLPKDLKNWEGKISPKANGNLKVFSKWLNIKDLFRKKFPHLKKPSMPDMLETLGLPLVGRHHSGLDDTRNLASIVLKLGVDVL